MREVGLIFDELSFNKSISVSLLKLIDIDESLISTNIKLNTILNSEKTSNNFQDSKSIILGKVNLQIAINFCKNSLFKYYTITNDQSIPFVWRSRSLQKILDLLHDSKIPYNIIVLDKIIYLFPRRHENLLSSKKFAFFEILGLYVLPKEEDFKSFQFSEYKDGLAELWLDDEVYSNLNSKIKLINS